MLFPKSCASHKTLHGWSFQHSLSRVSSLPQRRSSQQHSQFRPHTINADELIIKLFTDDVVLHERLNTTGKWPSKWNSFKLLTGTQMGGNAKVDPCVQVAVNTNCCNWVEHDPHDILCTELHIQLDQPWSACYTMHRTAHFSSSCCCNWIIHHDPHNILCTELHIVLAPGAATGSKTMIWTKNIYMTENKLLSEEFLEWKRRRPVLHRGHNSEREQG